MLTSAFTSVALAAIIGVVLAARYLRDDTGASAPWPLAALHGLLGVGGLAILLFALQGPPRGLDRGTASFGAIAATLLALAALAGGAVLWSHLCRHRRAGTLIGVHATLAVSGVVILAAYLLV